jgi:hypothetical protein
MKTNMKYALAASFAGLAFALACLAGEVVISPPTVVVSAPPVVVTSPAPVVAPDSYVWDGYEYVGVVGDQYYYLGPGNVWIMMDTTRFHRFQSWQHGHPDWRTHATHNVHYRNMDRPVQPQPMHYSPDTHPAQTSQPHVNGGQNGPPH